MAGVVRAVQVGSLEANFDALEIDRHLNNLFARHGVYLLSLNKLSVLREHLRKDPT